MKAEVNVIILAAGKGTRLGVDTPKPLLRFQGVTLIHQVLTQVLELSSLVELTISIVVGHQKEAVKSYISKHFSNINVEFINQDKQLGTGHAVSEFFSQTKLNSNMVMILCADTPLVSMDVFSRLIEFKNQKKLSSSGLSFIATNPYGYGRVKRVNNKIGVSIIEEKDASEADKKIVEVNSGVYLVDREYLERKIQRLDNHNKSGEFYLTDIMDPENKCDFLSIEEGQKVFLGVNTMKQLEEAEQIARNKRITEYQNSGVQFLDSKTVYIDEGVDIIAGVVIMPNVHLRGSTVIKKSAVIETGSIITNSIIDENVTVQPYSVINDSEILNGASVGPFARIRPGSIIGEGCKVGNFVETKKSTLKKGSKVSHLSYVGDAEIGENTNIGCGFITCNYDGKNKHKTNIGDNCFIGSDSQMVAPVKIGNDCFVASGSTINVDLQDGDFSISRSRQVIKKGMAKKFLKK